MSNAEERAKAIVEQWERQTDWGTELLVQMIAAALEEAKMDGPQLTDEHTVIAKLSGQIAQLQAERDELKKRVADLEQAQDIRVKALRESEKRVAELEEIGRVYCRDTDQHIEQLITDLDAANKRAAELEATLRGLWAKVKPTYDADIAAAKVEGLRSIRENLAARRSAEQIMRDDAKRRDGIGEMYKMHGDRAQMITDIINYLDGEIAATERGKEKNDAS